MGAVNSSTECVLLRCSLSFCRRLLIGEALSLGLAGGFSLLGAAWRGGFCRCSEEAYASGCTNLSAALGNHNAARNLAALAADTGESRRELPAGSDVSPDLLAGPAVAPPREEPARTQRHHREVVAR
ncbi:hypothetical protein [Pseudonocardia sp. H11422]|uniref:hypothetical protein n=1 Tax=Pseudonocardia sp. H11422 TaxID=2835866 RepID=UPI001BDD90A4|nr:hypothetical protein [Pseudonocardia sp. H11422]